ncbi:hypothetical protein KKG83_07600 [Candidatus Micrarchaeota archaeon]|nr:hypothetical protein [Candidatus Micrarchaeota archaeon]MBU2477305.1 hypothetical protein [Candidatus Micrarchaeota archaeon]
MNFLKFFSEEKELLKKIAVIFFASRLFVFLIGFFSVFVVPKSRFFVSSNSLFDLFFYWDSVWYISIVERGFSYIPGEFSTVAFFPLYPLLIKLFSFVLFDSKLSGYLISNISFFLALFFLYKLISLDYSKSIASKTVFFISIAPLTFFFSIIYTEGLFVFLAILSFYFARKKQWFYASVSGFFLALTNVLGVLIIIPLLMEYFDLTLKNLNLNYFRLLIKKIEPDIFFFSLPPLGLLTYMFYLFLEFNEPLAFKKALFDWSAREFVPFFVTLTRWSYDNFFHPYNLYVFLFIFVGVFFLAYLIHSKVRPSYVVFPSVLFFFYLSSNSLEGIPRYVSFLFPLYLGVALLSEKNKNLNRLLILFSLSLLIFCTVLFVNGYFLND